MAKKKTTRAPRRPATRKVTTAVNCDPLVIDGFDYGPLTKELHGMSKPAQRALINAKILTLKQLSQKTIQEVLSLHGMGKSSIPVLKSALKKAKLKFTGAES